MNLGAHINKDKTIINTINNILKNGGNALQLFVSNPRSAHLSNIDNYINIKEEIIDLCNKNNFKLVIHSSYVINLAKELKYEKKILDIEDCYWIKLLINELIIAHIINAVGCVFHVGKYVSLTEKEGLNNMKIAIEFIINYIKKNKLNSKLIIETPAGQGTELLTDFDDFLKFYNLFDNKYIKICIDTAHVWSSGYELIEINKKLKEYNNEDDVAVIHLNNSKKNKGSKVDTHEELEKGKMILHDIISFLKKFKNLPIIILEKTSSKYKNELNLIYNKLLE
jgi:deoxyribonuclease-4